MSGFNFPKIDHNSVIQRFKDNLRGQQQKDERFFRLTKDKSGQGAATIRFLPGKVVDGKEQLNYEPFFRHSLQIDGYKSNYNVICPTSHGLPCPICEWNKMQDGDFVFKNGFYRQRKYISNILVIDEKNTDLIGKVHIIEYGPQIMEMLESKLYPKEIAGKKKPPFYYYDWEAGANFELILAQNGGFPNWKSSEFLAPSSIMEFLEEKDIHPQIIVDSLYDLKEVVAGLDIPSYDTIKREFYTWIDSVGLSRTAVTSAPDISNKKAIELQTSKNEALNKAVKEAEETPAEESDINEVVESSKPADPEPKKKIKSFQDFISKDGKK